MPLEQDEPYHHLEDYDRPHALLSHDELAERLAEFYEDPEIRHKVVPMPYPTRTDLDFDDKELMDNLIAEHYMRERENKVEPTEGFEEHQPFEEDFQDLHRSDDIFEQAWGVMKAKDEGWFDDSRFPLADDVCENCEGKKDPNDELCRACMRRMLGV